ncbi:MAG: RNA polymerase sigma factor, partial [Gemmatimonadaceae bacterium]
MSDRTTSAHPAGDVPALVEHLFRHHAAELVARLARILGPGQLDLAEDVVQEALLSALRAWSVGTLPDNPRAWLTAVARNRALDRIRSDRLLATHGEELRGMLHPSERNATAEADDALADDQLRLIFLCCHPAIPAESRTALTLKLAGGFSVAEIARAMLAEESAIAQRIVRAKRRIRDDGIPLTLPDPPDLGERLGSVLEVLYLMFNEGYLAHSSDEVLRRDLCHEALRMALL